MTLIAALSSMGSVQSNNSIFKSQVGVTGTSSSQSSNKIALIVDVPDDVAVAVDTLSDIVIPNVNF
ncbi:hypothetical protein PPL_03321 [Heterostelium album PN500]|uniref:Uncharacterized protein n=1 Tax=Heterostelium pallidum (strain ATCC 26659 / Pp 5 / PN500) TaxID=670386 RepID=D3B4J6_HETP5|nr:hypothetical protein PPL_03321 [Heterostelium album PN500]EFA84244.1 hypothetical protein PPL_03321 [Heterostelium album PN500]|eukprot:XP_020436360.1 hypothetical protein PPL_03321 [Heterostelium album PN500]